MTEHLGCPLNNNNLINELLIASKLIVRFSKGDINFSDFLGKYDNFIYRIGIYELSEKDKSIMNNYIDLLSIHIFLQENILNNIYTSVNVANNFSDNGFISEKEAQIKIIELFNLNKNLFSKYNI